VLPCATPPKVRLRGGSVSRPISRVLSGGSPLRDGHSSGTPLARRLEQPTRAAAGIAPGRPGAHKARAPEPPCRPYSVLLPVGFAVPPPLPKARCALTAPFHPCPCGACPARAVSFLWHFPWGRPRRPLAATDNPWSPDFPPPRACGHKSRFARQRPSGRLTGGIRGEAGPGSRGCPSAPRAPPAASGRAAHWRLRVEPGAVAEGRRGNEQALEIVVTPAEIRPSPALCSRPGPVASAADMAMPP
jgi:hypothetical protein